MKRSFSTQSQSALLAVVATLLALNTPALAGQQGEQKSDSKAAQKGEQKSEQKAGKAEKPEQKGEQKGPPVRLRSA